MSDNFIDCTPTWLGLLPGMLEVYKQHGSPHESTCEIYAEFVRMATAADRFNRLARPLEDVLDIVQSGGKITGFVAGAKKEESNE